MNSKITKKSGIIDVREIVWDLLSQWKAVCIVALLTMLLVSGAKYAKDYSAYKESSSGTKQQTDIPAEEKIETILDNLSAADRSDVEYVIKEKDWIRKQREYLNDSILMNVDPTNQRALLMDYNVSTDNNGDMSALVYGYLGQLYNDTVIEKVGQVIAPETGSNYIAELISYDKERYSNVDPNADSIVLEFRIVVPEGVDAAAVEKAVTGCLNDYSSELTKTIGSNSISLLSVKDFTWYNSEAVTNRTNITYSIHNIQNNIKSGESALSDEAKAALEAINAVNETGNSINEGTEESAAKEKPGISKKYALFGFVLGVMIYVFCYLVLTVARNRLYSPANMRYYTGSRLLGDVYGCFEKKGFLRLLNSAAVTKYRYGERLNTEKQLEKIVSTVGAVSAHAGIKEIVLFCMEGLPQKAKKTVDIIADKINEKGVRTSVVFFDDDINESLLPSVRNAVIVADRNSKSPTIITLSELCKEYDVNILGNIFFG